MLMSGSKSSSRLVRRTLLALAAAASFAFPLGAIAWQGPEWNSGLRWTDGREVQWRVSSAPGCDGSNVELRLLNNSQASGFATMKEITFNCARGSAPSITPERPVGQISPGGAYAVAPISCACAEKGGVRDIMSVGLDIVRNGPGAETPSNGRPPTAHSPRGQAPGRGP